MTKPYRYESMIELQCETEVKRANIFFVGMISNQMEQVPQPGMCAAALMIFRQSST